MKFCGFEVPDNYYRGKKFIAIAQITKMYGLKDSAKVSSTIHRFRNKGQLVEGVDYFHLSMNECGIINGIDHTKPVPKGQHVLTEKGFKILQPKFDAWEIEPEVKEVVEEVKPESIDVLKDGFNEIKNQLSNKDKVEEPLPLVEPEIIPEPAEVVEEEFGVTTSATVTNVNFTEMVGLMNKTLDMLASVIAQQSDDHKQMVRQLTENNKEVCKLITEFAYSRQSKVKADDYIIDTAATDYQTWKKNINKAVDKIVELTNQPKNEVLSECYRALTREYGYVFDDMAKKFYNEYNRGPINSMENIWYGEQNNPAYKNLMIAKLSNMYREAEKLHEANS